MHSAVQCSVEPPTALHTQVGASAKSTATSAVPVQVRLSCQLSKSATRVRIVLQVADVDTRPGLDEHHVDALLAELVGERPAPAPEPMTTTTVSSSS